VQPSSIAIKDKTVTCKLPLIIGTRRGPACRDSYPGSHASYSLNRGIYPPMGSNRVGSIYGEISGPGSSASTLSRFTTGTAPRYLPGAEYSYYQNVVFPLVRHSSAPIYENYRFPCTRSGPNYLPSSPFVNQESLEEGFEDTEEGGQQRYEGMHRFSSLLCKFSHLHILTNFYFILKSRQRTRKVNFLYLLYYIYFIALGIII